MARTRRARPDLTESWDDVDDDPDASYSDQEQEHEYERPQTRNYSRAAEDNDAEETPRRRRVLHSVVVDRDREREPQLVMPSSPNAAANGNGNPRSKTPRFRLNERSMTSDAGKLADSGPRERARDQTPRFRMNDRSMTSDAGKFARKRSTLQTMIAEDEQEDEDMDGDGGRGLQDSLPAYVRLAWIRILHPVLAYCSDIVGLVLNNAKPLIAYALFAYLLVASLVFGSGFLTNSINNALSPICRIPGVTRFFHPSFCPAHAAAEIAGPAEFDKLVQAQSAFNDVLVASSTGVNLPLDMKRSEAGIRDLKHVVEYSSLQSKNELVYEFTGFIDTARQASQDLSRFNSRIGHAVDRILSTNRWTLKVIDGLADAESHRGSVVRFLSDNLNIFAPFQPVPLSQDLLLDQYLKHTSAVEDQILSLIAEAQALLGILENLDGRLDMIAGIATRDGLRAEENRDELFAYLWTKLGGNRSSVRKLNNQIDLLNNVGQYRRVAWAHVSTTIVKLQAIRNDLEDLRERVAMPEIVGTERVPLEVHIEAINLGIQRLEEQRESSKKVEAEAYQRVLARVEAGDGKMIGDREL